MATSTNKLTTVKSVLSTVGTIAATTMVARSIINDFLPREIHNYIFSTLRTYFTHHFSSDITFVIDEFHGLEPNQLFEAAELYLATRSSATTTTAATSQRRLKVSKPESENTIKVALDQNEEVVDVFDDVTFRWVLQCQHIEAKNYYNPRDVGSTLKSEVRSFCLTFHKKGKVKAIDEYLPHVLKQAEVLKHANKTIKLYTTDFANMYGHPGGAWSSITLNHPATFDTLAMDSEIKRMIIDDLERFVKRKEYYRRVGKAWKRGYLLYGPPGTGKSSLIAAMANYLNFDIYDLELSGLRSDSELRMLLVGTGNKSILVVEDVDCSIELKDRQADQAVANPGFYQEKEQVTLSGLLNFIDGLWSSCGDERIIIFTTNHKDKLDPALLRPGRMDMHIHMSYCTPCGFKILANNYLNIKHHALFEDIERLIEEVEITPAEVAEQLMKQDEPDLALAGLLDFLNLRKIENVESKAKQLEKEIEPKANDGDGEVKEVNTNEVQGSLISYNSKSRLQPMWRRGMRCRAQGRIIRIRHGRF